MPAPTMKLAHKPEPLTLAQEKLRLVVYGDPGVGKTTLALTAPRPFVIDTDGGLVSAAIKGVEATVYRPQGYRDLEALCYYLRDTRDSYDTIVVDSLPALCTLTLNEIVDEGKGKHGSTVTDMVPEQAEYGANLRQIQRFLNWLKALNKHVIVTAGVRESKTSIGKNTPDLIPSILKDVQYWSSVTAELVIAPLQEGGEPQRILATVPSKQREAKSRFESLTPFVVDPTFPRMWEAVMKEYQQKGKGK